MLTIEEVASRVNQMHTSEIIWINTFVCMSSQTLWNVNEAYEMEMHSTES
ncbi:MAG: hypothetical protein ACTS6A_00760 [Candidatus Hodgkinia cicadicola]